VSDKLNVVISDNGFDIDISALSGGERARVNVAALLGIRKIMKSLSGNRINLLILDETIENLDLDGKEKLVEVLLAEEHLNTFIISHGFSHPLLEKIQVTKTNNISRIE
jgi:DNA repair exonuclease SbcCD ATPase subunit